MDSECTLIIVRDKHGMFAIRLHYCHKLILVDVDRNRKMHMLDVVTSTPLRATNIIAFSRPRDSLQENMSLR
jgi:hypothetical protein